MLRRVLIASAALAMVLVTSFPDNAFARGGVRAGGYRGGTVAVRGPRGGAVAARGYRGGAVAVRGGRYDYCGYGVGAGAVGAAGGGAAGAGVRLRRGPTAAAAATTPTATGFARAGIMGTEQLTPLACAARIRCSSHRHKLSVTLERKR